MSKTGSGSRLRRGCFRFLLIVGLLGFGLTVAGATALVAVIHHFSKGLPDVGRLRHYEPSETTRVYASDGTEIARLYKENRTWAPIGDIAPYMVKAVIAIEDSRFYSHHGIDPIGVLRAAYYDWRTGGANEGASTITMQLARNLYLTRRRRITRKIKEALLAMQIEKKFTKAEIMEFYLNQIYYGAGAYGIEAAARTYFGTNAKSLDLAQASLLAGLPQAPSEYSPLYHPKAARRRQFLVLQRMLKLGFITRSQYLHALRETLTFNFRKREQHHKEHSTMKVPYFTTYVLHRLFERYDANLLYRGGLRIYTTVDLRLQRKARAMLRFMVEHDSRRLRVHTGALVCIQNKTGFIRAMVGGLGWSVHNQFNRAWQARRQPGSSFKVFVFTTAMQEGFTPDTVVPDTPVTYTIAPHETWTPKNDDLAYMGNITLTKALQYSRNVVAVKLLTMVGPEKVIAYAHKMGIKDRLAPHLSLALGAVGVSPLEMASAYSVLPDDGIKVQPTAVKVIYDSEGNVVEDHTFPKQKAVVSDCTAREMIGMMRRVVQAGTGTAARLPHRQVAGKTGTTDDFRDAWFCGFTPRLTTTVWVGNDDDSRMDRSYGGDLPAKIWHHFMSYALKGLPPRTFWPVKDGKVQVLMCADSHLRANSKCPNTYKAYLKPDHLPPICDLHGRTTRWTPQVAGASPVSVGTTPAGQPTSGSSKSPQPGRSEVRPPPPPQEAPDVIPEPVPLKPSPSPRPRATPAPDQVPGMDRQSAQGTQL